MGLVLCGMEREQLGKRDVEPRDVRLEPRVAGHGPRPAAGLAGAAIDVQQEVGGARADPDFEECCAYFAKHADRSFVARTMRVTWRSVTRIVGTVVGRSLGLLSDRLDGLRHIGIDELSYRKHHEYITTVVDHERGRVMWTGKVKNAATLVRSSRPLARIGLQSSSP